MSYSRQVMFLIPESFVLVSKSFLVVSRQPADIQIFRYFLPQHIKTLHELKFSLARAYLKSVVVLYLDLFYTLSL